MEQGTQPAVAGIIVNIAGRILRTDAHQGASGTTFATIVRAPQRDAFTSGDIWKVLSKKPLGTEQQPVQVACDLRGYPRTYADKQGKQQRAFEMTLWARGQ